MYCVGDISGGQVLNLRAFPSAKSRTVTKLSPHQCDVAFLPYAVGKWQKVRVDGHEGWAIRTYLSGQ
jgi:SH3-like domain-containing protein